MVDAVQEIPVVAAVHLADVSKSVLKVELTSERTQVIARSPHRADGKRSAECSWSGATPTLRSVRNDVKRLMCQLLCFLWTRLSYEPPPSPDDGPSEWAGP